MALRADQVAMIIEEKDYAIGCDKTFLFAVNTPVFGDS